MPTIDLSPRPREARYLGGIELRSAPGGSHGPGILRGYAAVYDRKSAVLKDTKTKRSFVEIVKPGAFARSLREGADVRAMVDHNPGLVIGRVSAGTLKLQDDARGLHFTVDLPDTQAGRDLAVSVSRGDIQGCSFGFVTRKDSWDLGGDMAVRHLHDVSIDDVSICAYPAYEDTSVSMEPAYRSLRRALAGHRDEAVARELQADRDRLAMAGFPQR